jgi:phage tail-like protein
VRGVVPGLGIATPVATALPAVYQEDEFVLRFVAAFDEGLAPVVATLDNLQAYVDPELTPEDFLDWLGDWVGVAVDDRLAAAERRELVSQAVELHRARGTAAGIAQEVRLAVGAGARVEIVESGGARWSASPGSALPGDATPRLVVRVHVADPGTVDVRRVEALVGAAKPAHLPHTVEVLAS